MRNKFLHIVGGGNLSSSERRGKNIVFGLRYRSLAASLIYAPWTTDPPGDVGSTIFAQDRRGGAGGGWAAQYTL